MDNLMLKALEFLTVPQGSLAIVFLLVFIGMFLWGFRIYYYCRQNVSIVQKNAEEEYLNEKDLITPELYLKKKFSTLIDEESQLSGFPNAFVSVGILATFIGLGVSIQGASELLQEENVDIMRMTEVLGVIAFKFQTSIWGVLMSLLFQHFICERYFSFKQDVLDELMDTLYRIEGVNSRCLLEQQNKLLKEHINEEKTASLAQKERDEQFIKTVEELKNIVEFFAENTKIFRERTDAMGREWLSCVEKTESAVLRSQEQVAESVVKSEKQAIDSFKATAELFDKDVTERIEIMKAEMLEKRQDIDDTLHEIVSGMNQHMETFQKIFIRSEKEYVERTQKELVRILREDLRNIHKDYAQKSHELGVAISRFDDVLSGVNNSVDSMHSEFLHAQKNISDAHGDMIACWKNALSEFMRISESARQEGENVSKAIANATNVFTESSESYTKSVRDVDALLTKIMKDRCDFEEKFIIDQNQNIVNLINTLVHTQKIGVDELKREHKEWITYQRKQNQVQEEADKNAKDHFMQISTSIIEGISQLEKGQKDYTGYISLQNSLLEKYTKDFMRIVDVQQETIEQFSATLLQREKNEQLMLDKKITGLSEENKTLLHEIEKLKEKIMILEKVSKDNSGMSKFINFFNKEEE